MDSASGPPEEDGSLSLKGTPKSTSSSEGGVSEDELYLLATQATLSCLQQIAAGAHPLRLPIGLVAGSVDPIHHCIHLTACSAPIFLDATSSGAGPLSIGPQLVHVAQPINRAGMKLIGYYYYHCSENSGRLNGLLGHGDIIRSLQAEGMDGQQTSIIIIKLQSIVQSFETQGIEAGVRLDFYRLREATADENLTPAISPLPFKIRSHQYSTLADLRMRLASTLPALRACSSAEELQYDMHLSQMLLAGERVRRRVEEEASGRLSTSLLHLKWLIHRRVEELQQRWKVSSRSLISLSRGPGQDEETNFSRFRSLLNQLISRELASTYAAILEVGSRDNHLLWQTPSLKTSSVTTPASRGSKRKKAVQRIASLLSSRKERDSATIAPSLSSLPVQLPLSMQSPPSSSPSSSSSHPRPILPAGIFHNCPRAPSSGEEAVTRVSPSDITEVSSTTLMSTKLTDSLLLLGSNPLIDSPTAEAKVIGSAESINQVGSTTVTADPPTFLVPL